MTIIHVDDLPKEPLKNPPQWAADLFGPDSLAQIALNRIYIDGRTAERWWTRVAAKNPEGEIVSVIGCAVPPESSFTVWCIVPEPSYEGPLVASDGR